MSSNEEKTCAGKTRYQNISNAEEEIKKQKQQRRRLRAYACSVCHGWHLTKED